MKEPTKDVVRRLLRALTRPRVVRSILRRAGHAHVLPNRVAAALPVEDTITIDLPHGQQITYSVVSDDGIGRKLHWLGWKGWEPETTPHFYRLARSARVVVDIGANTGYFTLLAARANEHSEVLAFEPVPLVFDRLSEHIVRNGLEDRITARQAAVGDQDGQIQLSVPKHGAPVGATLDLSKRLRQESEVIEVPICTLDAAAADLEALDVLKIDVEGCEDQVLRGGEQTIRKWRPTIFIEALPEGPIDFINDFFDELGYRRYHLLPRGPREMPRFVPDEHRRYQNYLCSTEPMT